jgi:hypothetical protein
VVAKRARTNIICFINGRFVRVSMFKTGLPSGVNEKVIDRIERCDSSID